MHTVAHNTLGYLCLDLGVDFSAHGSKSSTLLWTAFWNSGEYQPPPPPHLQSEDHINHLQQPLKKTCNFVLLDLTYSIQCVWHTAMLKGMFYAHKHAEPLQIDGSMDN
jgi:hypothetical protein